MVDRALTTIMDPHTSLVVRLCTGTTINMKDAKLVILDIISTRLLPTTTHAPLVVTTVISVSVTILVRLVHLVTSLTMVDVLHVLMDVRYALTVPPVRLVNLVSGNRSMEVVFSVPQDVMLVTILLLVSHAVLDITKTLSISVPNVSLDVTLAQMTLLALSVVVDMHWMTQLKLAVKLIML